MKDSIIIVPVAGVRDEIFDRFGGSIGIQPNVDVAVGRVEDGGCPGLFRCVVPRMGF